MTTTTHEPDWPDELVKGEKLAECIVDLLDAHSPEEVAPVLGYCYMDEKGHDQPLVDHLKKEIEEVGIDVDNDPLNATNKYTIFKNKLCRFDDNCEVRIYVPTRLYNEASGEYYDDGYAQFKELVEHYINEEGASDEDEAKEMIEENHNFTEPMIVADLTSMVWVDKDLENGECFSNEDLAEFNCIPYDDVHHEESWIGYG